MNDKEEQLLLEPCRIARARMYQALDADFIIRILRRMAPGLPFRAHLHPAIHQYIFNLP